MNLFLATNRRKYLHTLYSGDPNQRPYNVWDFANDVEPGQMNHFVTVTGLSSVAAYPYYTWAEYSAEQTWLDAFAGLLPGAGRSVTVYIHGFNMDFKAAVAGLDIMSRELAGDLYAGAAMAYDWPSLGGVHLYSQDKAHADASVGQLVAFLDLLRTACEAGGIALNLVCHSMGNYLVSLVGRTLAWQGGPGSPWVDRLVMAGADVPRTLFDVDGSGAVKDPSGRGLIKMCSRIVVLYSPEDPALKSSEEFENPDQPRLGRLGPAGPLPSSVEAYDLSKPPYNVTTHGGYFEPGPMAFWAPMLK